MRVIDAADVLNTVLFATLAPAAWVLPERIWPSIASGYARLHVAMRGSSAAAIEDKPAVLATGMSARALERALLAGNYLETMQTLREHRPGGWTAPIRLVGAQHVASARAQGRGAVLWLATCNFASINTKKALRDANWPLVHLRSDVHPYSGTRFGRAVLNRLRTSVEDRYLAEAVILREGNAALALRLLKQRLQENAVVSITASAAADRPFRVPCLGGTLALALGAPSLALAAKCDLLPVFATPRQQGEYRVEVEAPLRSEDAIAGRTAQERLASAFAPRLEAFVKRYPTAWRGWLVPSQWQAETIVDDASRSERVT